MSVIEKRIFSVGCSLRAESSGKELSLCGYAAKFGVLSHPISSGGVSFRERIAKGAFTRALAEKQDVIATIQHDPGKVLGRTKSGTLRLAQDDTGLAFRVALDPNQSAHRDLHSACARGDFDSCSFAFTVPDGGDDWDDTVNGECVRTLRNVNLMDVAIVQHPAYPQTEVNARSLAHYSVPKNFVRGPQGEEVPLPVRSAPVRPRTQNSAAADAELRAKAVAYADQIRRDYITDPSCKAVRFDGKVFHRDFAREAEMKSLDLLLDAGPNAVIAELNRRASVGFEAEPLRNEPGQTADPTASLRDDEDDFYPWDASDKDEHERAAAWHRAVASKARTMEKCSAHHGAADAHALAARTGDANDSSRARAASRLLKARNY